MYSKYWTRLFTEMFAEVNRGDVFPCHWTIRFATSQIVLHNSPHNATSICVYLGLRQKIWRLKASCELRLCWRHNSLKPCTALFSQIFQKCTTCVPVAVGYQNFLKADVQHFANRYRIISENYRLHFGETSSQSQAVRNGIVRLEFRFLFLEL